MIGAFATGLTWLQAFKGPCLVLSLVALGAGAASGGWVASKFAEAKIAHAREDAANARADLERLQKEQTQAIADASAKNVIVIQDVLGEFNATKDTLRGIRDDIGGLRRAVRVCSSVSAMPVPRTPEGSDGAPASGAPRPAEDVLQDLATESATAADGNANRLNRLIDWIERTRAEVGGKAAQR